MPNKDIGNPREQNLKVPQESAINKLIRSCITNGEGLNQDSVYSTLASQLNIDEVRYKIREDLGDEADIVIEKVYEAGGEGALRLLVEPSILIRSDEFVDYLHRNNIGIVDLNDIPELRRSFKEFIGKARVYRTLILKENDLLSIRNEGFVSTYITSNGGVDEIANITTGYDSVGYNITDLRGRVHSHAHGDQNSYSTLISLSGYPEMSQYGCVAAIEDRKKEYQAQGYRAYTFPVEIDEASVIRYGKYLPRKFDSNKDWVCENTRIPYGGNQVELFAEFSVEPDKIDWDNIIVTELADLPSFHLE